MDAINPKVKISFCIPAYNQAELLKGCLESILAYPYPDIEIIVNDDASTEDIKSVVLKLQDGRIRYFRNKENIGHDQNILKCFFHADADYAYLLRTRDRLAAGGVKEMMKRIEENSGISYLTSSAYDELGKWKLTYNNRYYKKGREALKAHRKLYIHPSGSLYNISKLDLVEISQFIYKEIPSKYSFVAHNLIRMQLALSGGFKVLKKPVWIYTNTSMAADQAVNSAPDKNSVYTPSLGRMRYRSELLWAADHMPDVYRVRVCKGIYFHYLKLNTWIFKRRNEDPLIRRHYNCNQEKFSIRKEERLFLKDSSAIFCRIAKNKKDLIYFKLVMLSGLLVNHTYGACRFYGISLYRKLRKIWKGL